MMLLRKNHTPFQRYYISPVSDYLPYVTWQYLRLMYHRMLLLHVPIDVVQIYRDHAWQPSSDFLIVGKHAVPCANGSQLDQ